MSSSYLKSLVREEGRTSRTYPLSQRRNGLRSKWMLLIAASGRPQLDRWPGQGSPRAAAPTPTPRVRPCGPFGPSADQLRNHWRMTSSTWAPGRWRRGLTAWMPVAVPLAMEPVFTRAIRRFGPERGYQVGFAIYWVTCWTVAGAIAGPRRLAALWQPTAACHSCSNHESTGSTCRQRPLQNHHHRFSHRR
jgi:hypothetical protein